MYPRSFAFGLIFQLGFVYGDDHHSGAPIQVSNYTAGQSQLLLW